MNSNTAWVSFNTCLPLMRSIINPRLPRVLVSLFILFSMWGFEMLRTVYFDNQLCFRCIKINNKITDRLLPVKLHPRKLFAT